MMLTSNIDSFRPIVIQIEKRHLDLMESSTLELPIALHLMIKQTIPILCGDVSFKTTPQYIYDFMVHGVQTTSQNRTTRTNVVNALNSLSEKGLIKTDKEVTQWNTEVEIDASPLFPSKEGFYLSINSKDLSTITSHYGSKSTRALMTYFNILSYINWSDVKFYREEYCKGNASLKQDMLHNPELNNDWRISCYASMEALCSKPYLDAQPSNWISKATLSRYLHGLEELKLIKIISVSRIAKDGRTVSMNHYCLPDCEEGVEIIANRKIEQMVHSINESIN